MTMDGYRAHGAFGAPQVQPTSPPATPGTRSHPPRFPSKAASPTSPSSKRMGFVLLAHSPPIGVDKDAADKGYLYHSNSSLSDNLSSRASATTGSDEEVDVREGPEREEPSISEEDGFNDEEEEEDGDRKGNTSRRHPATTPLAEASFTIEEVSENDIGYDDSDTEVVHPTLVEDAQSDKAKEEDCDVDGPFLRTFNNLQCDADSESSDEEERRRRYERKKKRWSAGLYKRTHAQSVGSDSDPDDPECLDAHDVGSSARRLRRRVHGPGDRSSIVLDERPSIVVEEPEDGVSVTGPPSLPSDIEDFTLDALPFYPLDNRSMSVDSDPEDESDNDPHDESFVVK
ncbi:hypothetical protein BDY21DRAFT_23871 [Lineolata rhizophorae]|uniref:Uncharacterized protein n=1 Tax=Lineolata rhizophorae TaxID=578093 RepID=A0A6A6P0N0_9PEZI|nr:hypothetical protein BDY21DRAFT_23871 [Lineolata rhizophorae]